MKIKRNLVTKMKIQEMNQKKLEKPKNNWNKN